MKKIEPTQLEYSLLVAFRAGFLAEKGEGRGMESSLLRIWNTFEKDPGRKMRGAHAVGAYLSTTLPELTLAA